MALRAPVPTTGSTRARPFVDGTPCCYCDLPVFGSQDPQNRGLGAWCHAGCRRGRPARRLTVPAPGEVVSCVARSRTDLTAGDVQCEAESWLYSFWLRRCPVWPSVVVRSGRPQEVGALLDEIEDALDGCLWGSGGVPVRSSSDDLERALTAVAAQFAPVEARPLPAGRRAGEDPFTAWLEEGHALGFIVWGD